MVIKFQSDLGRNYYYRLNLGVCYDTVNNKNAASLILLARLTGSGVHELEGHVSDELSSQSAAVDLHPQRVRDDDTHGV